MSESVYKIIELVGTSDLSWDDAASDLRIGEITKLDMTIEDGKVKNYRARVSVSFRLEG
ncbi:MAG: dodecin domain-containing protein [Deltaproteobacteria bacterium]|nr:dodecin domain-containing protein [Deltaproteobacteria bacterium]